MRAPASVGFPMSSLHSSGAAASSSGINPTPPIQVQTVPETTVPRDGDDNEWVFGLTEVGCTTIIPPHTRSFSAIALSTSVANKGANSNVERLHGTLEAFARTLRLA
eukprot:3887992-Amphidinium_carterae.1